MRKLPILQGDSGSGAGLAIGGPGMQTPVYMELVNKKKVFDLDDRLIVLYFSAMNYIGEVFSFWMPRSEFYAPMRVNDFRRLLGHRGLVELRRIKHKYFADKFLRLYNIMKAFFEWGGKFSACSFESEYLLTSKYNNVFEAMIDKLVGDDLPANMEYLKSQKDGKEVDHLYEDRQLIFADDAQKIWFFGDSKYYSDKNDIVGESVYKQFTYARNIIQYNINDLLDFSKGGNSGNYDGFRYRDPLTEGYSVTPNFFVRGEVPDRSPCDIPDAENSIRKDGADMWQHRNRHFENRLFDRDTLLLQVYDVNFLYVLKAFTAKGSGMREEFKRTAREMFRKNFMAMLRSHYFFWYVNPQGSQEEFVNAHYKTLQGKLFRSGNRNGLVLALEQTFVDEENAEFRALRTEIDKNCEFINVDPTEIWEDAVSKGEKGLKRPGRI